MEGINGTPKTLGRYYKRGIKPLIKGIQQQLIREKWSIKECYGPKYHKYCVETQNIINIEI